VLTGSILPASVVAELGLNSINPPPDTNEEDVKGALELIAHTAEPSHAKINSKRGIRWVRTPDELVLDSLALSNWSTRKTMLMVGYPGLKFPGQ